MMDVNTRIRVGRMLSSIREFQENIESIKEDLNRNLTDVNKILTENGELPVTIEDIMKERDELSNMRPIRYHSRF